MVCIKYYRETNFPINTAQIIIIIVHCAVYNNTLLHHIENVHIRMSLETY